MRTGPRAALALVLRVSFALGLAPLTGGAAAGPASPAAETAPRVAGFLYTRAVTVPAAGTVRVPLDLTTLRHLEGDAPRVFAPDGTEVASRLEPFLREGERRPVAVTGVEPAAGGWTVDLDLGPSPPPHERLFFDFVRLAAVPAVRLDGSADGKSWEPLAVGDLFQLGGGAGLQRTSLAYAATALRYLRLHWPERAGFPEVQAVEVEAARGPSLSVTTRRAACGHPTKTSTVCTLALPAPNPLARRLALSVGSSGEVGYRLYEPRDGRWHRLAEGIFRGAGESRHSLPFGPDPLVGDLRLELYGEAEPPPALESFGFDLVVETVLFTAGEAGVYTLAYGASQDGEERAPRHGAAGREAAWIEPGPEREQTPVPPLPAAAAAPGRALRGDRFTASFRVVSPGTTAGDLVRLALPAAVYARARPDLGDLRLAAGGRQIPYLRWTAPAPAVVIEKAGLQPAPQERRRNQAGGESRLSLDLPITGLPVTQIFLTGPGGPLRRPVEVRYLQGRQRERRGLRRLEEGEWSERAVAAETWDCAPSPPLPCRAVLPLAGTAPAGLAVTIEDGDDPPLAALGVSVWRRSDVLLFVWPAGGNVRLLAGAPHLAAPDYDLAALKGPLLARPWHPAEVDLAAGAAAAEHAWARWLLPATLALAALFLLLLLRRILAEA